MTKAADFLAKVDEIQAEKPTYRLGGKAADGTCDCIGLVIGALARCGVKWPGIHGSNWAARSAMAYLLPVAAARELAVGEVVYKAKEPGAAGYALPSRYSADPDRRDYYHVGVVRSVQPLRIVHCTSPGGMTTDTKLGKWAFRGWLTMVEEGGTSSATGELLPSSANADATSLNEGGLVTGPLPQTEGAAPKSPEATGKPLAAPAGAEPLPPADVTSPDGNPVKLRAKPSRQCALYWLVPSGATVAVLAEDGDWWRVRYGARTGYMMAEFLSRG